jgi:hypothetical protein
MTPAASRGLRTAGVLGRPQGQRLGPAALRLAAGWFFGERGHHRLTIDPACENERAIRAYALGRLFGRRAKVSAHAALRHKTGHEVAAQIARDERAV